jgi:hypothetical protein
VLKKELSTFDQIIMEKLGDPSNQDSIHSYSLDDADEYQEI